MFLVIILSAQFDSIKSHFNFHGHVPVNVSTNIGRFDVIALQFTSSISYFCSYSQIRFIALSRAESEFNQKCAITRIVQ